MMVVLGTDAHKRSHTIVAVDPAGVEIGSVTVAATTDGHLRAMQWAAKYTQRQWAIEDCRALSRRLEGDFEEAETFNLGFRNWLLANYPDEFDRMETTPWLFPIGDGVAIALARVNEYVADSPDWP